MTTADKLYSALGHVKIGGTTCIFTPEKCAELAPLIDKIQDLKKQKNAVLLAHSYVSPEILYIADFVGDSYELSKKAQAATADTIVFSAVKFMAETAKILNPSKRVLVPSKINGCSLADSITAQDVRRLKAEHPDFTFVCYINTTAEVKAECDVCVTSSNCVRVVTQIPNDKIYFLPDKLMAQNIQNQLITDGVQKTLKWWAGTCYVHEAYDPEMITYLRSTYPRAEVVSHPECSPEVLAASDYVGSTSQMIEYIQKKELSTVVMLTECGLASRLQMQMPQIQFVGSCTMCRYMKSNTLADIIRVLESPDDEDRIVIDSDIIEKARLSIDAMFRYTEPQQIR